MASLPALGSLTLSKTSNSKYEMPLPHRSPEKGINLNLWNRDIYGAWPLWNRVGPKDEREFHSVQILSAQNYNATNARNATEDGRLYGIVDNPVHFITSNSTLQMLQKTQRFHAITCLQHFIS